jgi:hypothetical protein
VRCSCCALRAARGDGLLALRAVLPVEQFGMRVSFFVDRFSGVRREIGLTASELQALSSVGAALVLSRGAPRIFSGVRRGDGREGRFQGLEICMLAFARCRRGGCNTGRQRVDGAFHSIRTRA